MSGAELSVFLAGDAMMMLPWSSVDEPAFLRLIAEMRGSDVTILNLETVIHTDKGYAQAHSGGTWTASPPEIAGELAWAGVNMVAHANNHTFDYGSEGVLETIQHVTQAGIMVSGSGKDLQAARAPSILQVKGHRVAHLAMAASFVPYGKASKSRHDHRGRPGLNPLALTGDTVITIPAGIATVMRRFDYLLGRDLERYRRPLFRRFGYKWKIGARVGRTRGIRPMEPDRAANLAAIADASAAASLVIVSLHAHDQSAWLRRFARDAIAAGADIVLIHGPHEVQGIELVNGRPIFYCLGDFVYQAAQVSVFPSDAYEAAGLDDHAGPADMRAANHLAELSADPKTFEGCASIVRYERSKPPMIRLLPVDLQYGGDIAAIGRPRLAEPELAKKIIGDIANRSRQFGTVVYYDSQSNTGIVQPVTEKQNGSPAPLG